MLTRVHPDVVELAATVGVDLSTALFPDGYAGNLKTLEQVAARRTVQDLHPEMWRRVSGRMVWLYSQGVLSGVGSATRYEAQQLAEFLRRHTTTSNGTRVRWTFQGQKWYRSPGFAPYAPPGKSNHEQRATPQGAIAVDGVTPVGHGAANEANDLFGLSDFANVNREPWHVQPVETPNSRADVDRWVAQGNTLDVWEFPSIGVPPPKPAPDPLDPIFNPPPPKVGRMTTLTVKMEILTEGDTGRDVARAQGLCNALGNPDPQVSGSGYLEPDGIFGPATAERVAGIQEFFGLKPDSEIGPKTWSVLIDL